MSESTSLPEGKIEERKIKCREYNACNNNCLECDLLLNQKCKKKIDFDTPKRFVRVERKDCCATHWNECPTCRYTIGYRPDIKNFRCKRCGQRIAWQ